MRFGVEPLNRFETDILNTARQGVELVKIVAHPAIGLMLDTFHMNMEDDDIPGALRAAGPHLVHFQANENHRGYLGTGHLDWTAILRAIGEMATGARSRSSRSVAATSASAYRSRNGRLRRPTNRSSSRPPARSSRT